MKYFSGTNIHLRALEPEDLDILYHSENDSSLWQYGSTLVPYSRFTLREYLQNGQNDIYQTRQLRLMITCNKDKKTVGTIDLFDFDPHHRRAAIGILIFPGEQNKGFGTEALNLLSEYAFEFLHLHQLYAHIPQNNTYSLKLFSHCGFTQCGYLHEWIQKNAFQYEDVILMQKIEPQISINSNKGA